MKDEFVLLRLLILLSTSALVLGVVVRACQEAATLRAQMVAPLSAGHWLAGQSSNAAPASASSCTDHRDTPTITHAQTAFGEEED